MANEFALDDVTTIFVVGFPDDMTEREFQNMFVFSSGFEGASLKRLAKDSEDDASAGASNGKKQMIGFARFRTRMEALEAVEILNGKRVDQEKGTQLKAEMAKKNLHIKRGSIAPGNGQSQPLDTMPPVTETIPASVFSKRPSLSHYDTFSPLLSDLLPPLDYHKPDPFANIPFSSSTPTTPLFNDGVFGFRSQSFDARNDIHLMSPPRGLGLGPPSRFRALQDSFASNDPFYYLSKSSPVAHGREFGSTSSLAHDLDDGLVSPVSAMPFHPSSTSSSNLTELRSPSFSSSSLGNAGRSFNPADQNPPCNTLYVGNLPSNTNEEELRQLFSQCLGYKRMSFRNKSQGPMCFVEFEDVAFATQAMNDLQGYMLTSSVKGGIRLSFSKNPLFIKPAKQTTAERKDSLA